MPSWSWIPFVSYWKTERVKRAEASWRTALSETGRQEASADASMASAVQAGALPSFEKASLALAKGMPMALDALLKKRPDLIEMVDPIWDDTLLHMWARQPQALWDSSVVAKFARLLVTPHGAEKGLRKAIMEPVNAVGETPRMLAARAGNWTLMKALNDRLLGQRLPASPQFDDLGRHWVDYWADGVIQRHQTGFPLRLSRNEMALVELMSAPDMAMHHMLYKTESREGSAITKLQAAGVDARLLEFIQTNPDPTLPSLPSTVGLEIGLRLPVIPQPNVSIDTRPVFDRSLPSPPQPSKDLREATTETLRRIDSQKPDDPLVVDDRGLFKAPPLKIPERRRVRF